VAFVNFVRSDLLLQLDDGVDTRRRGNVTEWTGVKRSRIAKLKDGERAGRRIGETGRISPRW
jgi:hypothetical protein